MLRRILSAALGAGVGVGLLLAALQQVALVPLILEAEKYEQGPSPDKGAMNSVPREPAEVVLPALVAGAQAHGHEAQASVTDADRLWRTISATIATTLASVGFALVLVGAFAVSGRPVGAREGVLWGLAGFAAFALAPAFGLAPELPGAVAGDLAARQIWWTGTVAATALGLALLAFGRLPSIAALGLAVIALPQLVGAPHGGAGAGSAPPELAAAFAARTLVVAAVFWAVLGWAGGALYARLAPLEAR